ncbi:MAG TPA: DUF3054 domain-containing protein [Dehalococcoidia bacterium]|jgi:hypothetical protein
MKVQEIGLIAGDLVCFAGFALVGAHSHDEALTAYNLMRGGGMFALAWLALAAVTGLYGRRRYDLKAAALAFVGCWAAGLGLRWLLFGHAPKPGFAVVALVINGALLLGWRAMASRLGAGIGATAASR